MSNFKKLNTKIYQKIDSVTEDTIYWKKLGTPVLVKEFGQIDYVNFSPIEPYHFAVTCSVRVQIYNPITKLVVKNLSRFREAAYGATFKSDGKIICAGGEEGVVKLFDVASKSLLRLFKGHTAAVHRNFFVEDKPQILSCSDDKTVKLWDIPTETEIMSFSEHVDYIRAGAVNPALPNIFISGGYDDKINMYDLRTKEIALSLDHGAPVEALLFLPSGGIFISAGGNDIKVWDSFAGGRCLGTISEHHKTVTCLTMASDNKRILSGSLDRHVKVYDLNFKVVHTLDFPNSILSIGVSKNDDTLVAGFVDGIVSIHRRKEEKVEEKIDHKTNKNFNQLNTQIDSFVPEEKLEKEAKYDKYLRKFQFSKALDSVFVKYVTGKTPEKTVAVLEELIKRKALRKVLQGRDEDFIKRFLQFSIREITDDRFSSVVREAFEIFLEEFEDDIPNWSLENSRLLAHFKDLCGQILEMDETMVQIDAFLNLLCSAAVQPCGSAVSDSLQLLPSQEAQKDLILDIN
ncbi:U3 small nucleolar RNA-associated protein 15 homolog [Coccinella septempunctata]|uniref:U3 small nucleolar RNA-associated protein 15 homolog n=1 Tax=Coccinella septempunctata TaxID=41139 RepID=UPI001D0694D4|nr:U3 small nucleolar RNA-associated protein 15 homolog [Coccinella septempunctata]